MVRSSFMLWLVCVLVIAAALVLPSAAKLVPIPGEGCSIDLPEDWKVGAAYGFALIAKSADEKSAINLCVLPNPKESRIDESFYLEAMKQARQKKADFDHGSLIIIEAGTADINGVPASYIHTEEPTPDGQTSYGRGYLIAANDKFYSISADTSDPFLDKQINEIVGTFTFDQAPLLPDKERPFYRRFALVTGITACLVFFGGFAFWLLIRRGKMQLE